MNTGKEHWANRQEEVIAFGRDLVTAGIFRTADQVQEYYEKPWGWDPEHAWWEAHGRPDSQMIWDDYDPDDPEEEEA